MVLFIAFVSDTCLSPRHILVSLVFLMLSSVSKLLLRSMFLDFMQYVVLILQQNPLILPVQENRIKLPQALL